mgnify:CR=1 FL=1
MKVLLVEDNNQCADFITQGLHQSGFQVIHSPDGLDGLFKARTETFDIAVIDIMLPKLDGLTVIEEIRQAKIKAPIIVLSARDSVEDKVKGLETGADDYLAKPFSFSELQARIYALLRRTSGENERSILSLEDLELDRLGHRVTRGGKKLELAPLEFKLLEYLLRNKGRVVSRTTILEHVWEYGFDPQTNVVEAQVCRLREKIDKDFERKLLKTVRGFGYVLE